MTPACRRCDSPYEPEDLRCPVCSLPTPSNVQPRSETLARILRCHGCGAAVSYDPEIQAPKCDFCGSVMEVEVPVDPVEQAEFLLEFQVDARAAREALGRWLGSRGFFRPSDLRQASTIRGLQPLWWVGWVFRATVRVAWAADSNAGARRSDWAPHAGERMVELERVVVPASRGLTEAECSALISGYDLSTAIPATQTRSEGSVERFTVQRSSARQIVARALERVAARVVSHDVPGSTQRKLRVSVLPRRLETERYAFPAYVLAYRYRDRLYRAIVHGQDPSRIVGTAPWAWGRIATVALGVIVLLVAFVWLVGR